MASAKQRKKFSVQVEATLRLSAVYEVETDTQVEARVQAEKILKNELFELNRANDYIFETSEISFIVDDISINK